MIEAGATDLVSYGLACSGAAILLWRHLAPIKKIEARTLAELPLVSIVVPARNEEHNLPRLLSSLVQLDYPKLEIIVCDDNSTDATAKVAQNFPVQLLSVPSLPTGWRGKAWACQQGAKVAAGELILFTDADTQHHPDSLRRAISYFYGSNADLLTTLPYHYGETFWESLLGPFHALLYALTCPRATPKPRRLFAIGQYLLFRRSFYWQLGGHEAVRAEWGEDIPLGKLAVGQGTLVVYPGPSLFQVRMYGSLREFIAGWRRNFRAGMEWGSPTAILEATAIMSSFCAAGLWSWPTLLATFVSLGFVGVWQARIGNFSWFGIVLAPFSLFLFCLCSLLATWDSIFARQQEWKGRSLSRDAVSSEA